MERRGILIDQDGGDLLVRDGRIALGDNRSQCIERILMSNRGDFKEFPLVGGEIIKMLHGASNRFWSGRVMNMCRAMGELVSRIEMDCDGSIRVEI